MSEDQKVKFQRIFSKWDKNGDGTITTKEMFDHYQSFRTDLESNDREDSEVINFDQFVKKMLLIEKIGGQDGGIQEQIDIFKKYDEDLDGFISISDLR